MGQNALNSDIISAAQPETDNDVDNFWSKSCKQCKHIGRAVRPLYIFLNTELLYFHTINIDI